jgi:hypothetical protein
MAAATLACDAASSIAMEPRHNGAHMDAISASSIRHAGLTNERSGEGALPVLGAEDDVHGRLLGSLGWLGG